MVAGKRRPHSVGSSSALLRMLPCVFLSKLRLLWLRFYHSCLNARTCCVRENARDKWVVLLQGTVLLL